MKEIDYALEKLNDFFEVTSYNYAQFAKKLQQNPNMSRKEKDDLSTEASDKVVAAATPVIDFIVKAQAATTKLEKEIVALQREMDRKAREDEEFTESMRKECTAQVEECQSALKDAKKECKPKASEMPKTVKEAQSNAAANLETLQRKFDTMVRTFQAEAQQREKEVSSANARADKFEKQLNTYLSKTQSDTTDSKALATEIAAMQNANKELQQQIKQCRLETTQIQKLQDRAKEAEDEYGACEAERVELKQRLKELSERLRELEKTSGAIAAGNLEAVGEGRESFAKPKFTRRGSGIKQSS